MPRLARTKAIDNTARFFFVCRAFIRARSRNAGTLGCKRCADTPSSRIVPSHSPAVLSHYIRRRGSTLSNGDPKTRIVSGLLLESRGCGLRTPPPPTWGGDRGGGSMNKSEANGQAAQ